MEKKNYLLVKNGINHEIVYINYTDNNGYKFNPTNKKNNAISINQMVIINPTFIEKVLIRKTKRKLELYLQYIIELLDDDSDTSITGLRNALNDITRYKDIVNHKYKMYLDRRYLELFMKKLSLLEYELKMKVTNLDNKENKLDEKDKRIQELIYLKEQEELLKKQTTEEVYEKEGKSR